jgi:hypothetical protein
MSDYWRNKDELDGLNGISAISAICWATAILAR